MSPGLLIAIIVGVIVLLVMFLKQVNQYQRGVMFTMGRFTGIKQPGWRIVVPVFQYMKKVDIRVHVSDVPDQDAITKDNISVRVNAVVYYKVADARAAVIEIENYDFAVNQLAQTTMRDVVGEVELDDLLANRDKLSKRIRDIVEVASDPWGISTSAVEIKHIELPEEMKRTMAKQAEAERERRAVIIKAEGEVAAAENMSKAAGILAQSSGALHLRTLQSINDLSSDQSNTVIFAVPLEVLRAFEKISKPVSQ
jgi:regulator of protease activity HflC (stomatin/prohibitin superfamily)